MSRRLCLLSVSDKTGLEDLGHALVAQGYEILSTGGTARALSKAGVRYISVADFTGFPEIFDGRVKTLHPRIHGGILGRRGTDDAVADAVGISWIDLVVVNLYPFARSLADAVGYEDQVEQIDIGGPALIRAAAKNHAHVTVVVDPSDYSRLIAALPSPSAELRKELAARAFRHTARYDAMIASWFERQTQGEHLPATLALSLEKVQDLRYGENPHQRAALYTTAEGGRSLSRARQLAGKELSFNNLADLDAALRCAFEFSEPSVVVVKHANPCGAAVHPSLTEAFRLALSADPVSAYGGILALNRPMDPETGKALVDSKVFFEVVVAPGFSPEALELLSPRKNLRIMELPEDWMLSRPAGFDCKRIQGGWLLQDWDLGKETDWRPLVRNPSAEEGKALRFAWAVCRNVKSNGICLARTEGEGVVLNGVGAGQMSRVDSVRLAVQKATRPTAGSVLASDAFFPFSDGVKLAVEAGISAIVQPGGSIRDAEVIEVASAAGVAMVMTDVRHFRH